jgi:hypothetical protein
MRNDEHWIGSISFFVCFLGSTFVYLLPSSPTCRKVIKLVQGPDELPNNLLLISLMDVRPVKAQCPCCNKIEALTICEHCHSTKCSNCNEKHIKDIRDSTQAALDQLRSANQADLQGFLPGAYDA